jgi:hypothetical protein
VILRYLHYYSLDQIRKKQAHEAREAHAVEQAFPTVPATDGGTGDAG